MSQPTRLGIGRFFTPSKSKAYNQLKWATRDAVVTDPDAQKPVFEQHGLIFPEDWSLTASNAVAQHYFSGTEDRESSLQQLINRVVDTIVRQGMQEGYFESNEEAEDFREELKYVLATQRATFYAPVWSTIGAAQRVQQASEGFILAVDDTTSSMLQWYSDEAMVLKAGSAAGVNISRISPSSETSGPLSFMCAATSVAEVVAGNDKTRLAPNMMVMDAGHPDIEAFIASTAIETRKTRALWQARLDAASRASDMTSVRVTDAFMQAVVDDAVWQLISPRTGQVIETMKAAAIFHQIAAAAWECANPGIQFDSAINAWHTTPSAGRVNASSADGAYMHLDNSGCTLASINVLKYLREDNTFDIEGFKRTIELMCTAQEILVGYSEYPTGPIARNARAYRALGLGYTNLAALLMAQGIPYDSAEGRAQAGAITALLTGQAYATSAKIARLMGPFAGFAKDREGMLKALAMHREAISGIDASLVSEDLLSAAVTAWDEAVEYGERYGVRNAQVTLLPATEIVNRMMDSDTAGIEPCAELLKSKQLAGGGTMQVIRQTVSQALTTLGYTTLQIDRILRYLDTEKRVTGAPDLLKEHETVFDCSTGEHPISYLGRIRMMAAVQPFISGAVSKTIPMSASATIEDIEQLYLEAWRSGLKTLAVCRDTAADPQSHPYDRVEGTGEKDTEASKQSQQSGNTVTVKGTVRRRLPRRRTSKTYKFSVAAFEGYFTVSEYEDGTPGELFINVAKQSSTVAGLMDSFAIAISHGLQYGVPLKSYTHALIHTSFAPAGKTDDEDIQVACSITDYIMRRLALDYLSFDDRLELGLASSEGVSGLQTTLLQTPIDRDGTPGMIETNPSGAEFVCAACGSTVRGS